MLGKNDWTLLVQGINLHTSDGDKLLRHFDFAPFARLDDLMVSYGVVGENYYGLQELEGRKVKDINGTERSIILGVNCPSIEIFPFEQAFKLCFIKWGKQEILLLFISQKMSF